MIPKTPNDWAKWWRNVGAIPIPSYGIDKKPIIETWKHLQNGKLPETQFEQWLSEDAYRNGIQIIVGKILNNYAKEGFYVNCIDLDNEAAIKEFLASFGPGATLEKLAEKFIIEQHADKTKAHVLFYSSRPLKRLKYTVKDPNTPRIDILSDGKDLVVVTNSPHANGSRRQLLSNPEKIIYDCISVDADDLEKRIDTILSKYGIPYLAYSFGSDNGNGNKKKDSSFFTFDSNEKIKVGSRHNDLIRQANILIGKLYKITPIQAIKASIIEYNKQAYEIQLPDDEVDRIFNDSLAHKTGQLQQEKEQEIRDFPEIYTNIHFSVGSTPPRYIVASKEVNQVLEIMIKTSKTTGGKYLYHNKSFLACAPISIIIHKNPLTFLQTATTYTMIFVDSTGEKNTFSHKTLVGIMQSLKESGYVLGDGAEQALSAVLQAFRAEKLIEENEDIPYIGFFTDKDNKILASNIYIKEPNVSELADAIIFVIDDLKPHYENRIDLLSTLMVWGIVAPLIFMLKTNNYFLKALHLYGFANATKSNSGKIILALDGHHEDSRFTLNYSRIDTPARFGDAISKSTFPILIDEIKFDDKNNWLLNFIKSAIESKTARTKFINSKALAPEDIPSLSPLILTSNSAPPLHDSGYMRRTIARNHSQSESWKENDPKAMEFKEFLRINLPRLKALGDYRNWYLMNHQDEILVEKRPEPLNLGLRIIRSAFTTVGIEFPTWLEERLPENELEESMEDNEVIVKSAFEKYINENLNRGISIWRLKLDREEKLELPNTISGRFDQLVIDKILSDVKYSHKNDGFYIFTGILRELYKYGVTRDQLPNLKDLADDMGGKIQKYNGKKAIFVNKTQLSDYFDPKEKDNQRKIDEI